MNLIPELPSKAKRVEALFLGLAGVVFSGLCYWFMPVWVPAPEPRPLTVEERETVVLALSRLENHVPELSDVAEDVSDQIAGDDKSSIVDPSVGKKRLVRNEDERFHFSPHFFKADSYSQEISLAVSIDSMNPSPPQNVPDSIARRAR